MRRWKRILRRQRPASNGKCNSDAAAATAISRIKRHAGFGAGALGLSVGLLALAGPSTSQAAEVWWPQFRGPAASGVALHGSFPAHFGPDSNVVWQTAVPAGNGSPCIWEDRIFLTGAQEKRLLTLCLDRATGKLLWQREIQLEKTEPHSGLGSLANGTPATDGGLVCVYFGSFGLACYDRNGKEHWRRPLPIPITQHGAGTSPVLAGNLVLLVCDQDVGSYLLAVDKHTGTTVWKTDRSAFRRGFSTPLPYPPAQPELAIVTGTLRLMAYNLNDGSERWSISGLPNEMVSSPVAAQGLVYVAGWTHGSGPARLTAFDRQLQQLDKDGDGKLSRQEATSGPARQHFQYIDANKDNVIDREEWDTIADIFRRAENVALAVRPDGRGDVTASHVVWKHTRGLPYVPSPLVYCGRVYLVKNGGMATCLDAQTGRVYYQEERLGALGSYYASPIAADGKVCFISQRGLAVVIRAGEVLEVLARNNLGEQVLATPAVVGHHMYLRTKSRLYDFHD